MAANDDGEDSLAAAHSTSPTTLSEIGPSALSSGNSSKLADFENLATEPEAEENEASALQIDVAGSVRDSSVEAAPTLTPPNAAPTSASNDNSARLQSPLSYSKSRLPNSAGLSPSAGGYQWGTFIKRAVSSVEQSLDKVLDPALAEVTRGGDTSTATATTTSAPASAAAPAPTAAPVPSTGRISMQQRLALAMQAQKTSTADSSRSSSNNSASAGSARESLDVDGSDQQQVVERGRSSERKKQDVTETAAKVKTESVVEEDEDEKNISIPAISVAQGSREVSTPAITEDVATERKSTDSTLSTVDSISKVELNQKHEELQNSLGRVNILEEKVKYLSSQLLDYTQKNRSINIVDKRLAEKDEKIALLLMEGEQLSKNELKHMSVIKKLRISEREAEKAAADAQRKQERAEKDLVDCRERLRKSNEIERKQSERIKILAKSDSEVDILKRERDSLKATISNLREELAHANLIAEDAISKVQSDALEKEKQRSNKLQRELEELKAEQAMERERFAHEKFNLQSKMDRERERAKTREHELKEELSVCFFLFLYQFCANCDHSEPRA